MIVVLLKNFNCECASLIHSSDQARELFPSARVRSEGDLLDKKIALASAVHEKEVTLPARRDEEFLAPSLNRLLLILGTPKEVTLVFQIVRAFYRSR